MWEWPVSAEQSEAKLRLKSQSAYRLSAFERANATENGLKGGPDDKAARQTLEDKHSSGKGQSWEAKDKKITQVIE